MKKIFRTKEFNLTLVLGDITEYETDVLINWVNIDLISGSNSFLKIKEKGGDQFYYTLQQCKQQVKYADAFTLVPGFLPTNIVVNCIRPIQKEMYNDCLFNIKNTLQLYSKKKLCRYVSLTIPDKRYSDFILKHLLSYFKEITSIRELVIFVEDEEEFKSMSLSTANLLRKNSLKTFKDNLSWAFSNLLKK